MKPPREWPQPGQQIKAYSELTTDLMRWTVDHLQEGTPMRRIVSEIMDAAVEWHRVNRIGKKEPESNREEYLERNLNDARESLNHHAEALRQANQERDTLSAALKASEADVERLNALTDRQDRKIQELDADVHSLKVQLELKENAVYRALKQNRELEDIGAAVAEERDNLKAFNAELHEENQKLRTGQVAQAQDITKLRETLNEAMNSLSKERKRAEEAEKQRDHHLKVSVERYHEIEGLRQAPEVIKTQMQSIIREISKQRDAALEQLKKLQRKHDRLRTTFRAIRGHVAAFNYEQEKSCEEK